MQVRILSDYEYLHPTIMIAIWSQGMLFSILYM